MLGTPDFDYHLYGTRVRFAQGCAGQLAATLAELGGQRPVLLMQRRLAASPAGQALRAQLEGLAAVVLDGVPEHGSVAYLEAALAGLRAHRPDVIVAVGGGSVADSAKALALMLPEGARLAAYAAGRPAPPRRALLPIVSLPTTAAAAEVTPSIGLADEGRKRLFWCRDVAATEVLIDPDLAAGLPRERLLATAVNGIAHDLEGLYSRQRSPVSDALALHSLGLFAVALAPRAEPAAARRQILAAAHLSGMVLSMARTCLHHAICHVIGARHGVAHGAVNCVMLPHVLRFNAPAAPQALAAAAQAIGRASGAEEGMPAADWVAGLRATHGLPASLRALGLAAADLPEIARLCMHERGVALNPRAVPDADTVLHLLEQAYGPALSRSTV
ncbi:iron-containing alcohol dehydrogenase family protein [Bordetella hinzii]|uniref:Alcohol dehydrogenase, iron-dependent n=1 Tax=Bordetella hinzii OH87 BAL007II TaxID=1331262 RepID=A0ABR4R1H6_9BORD|nr:iron-containing alcohol dehydrogenase [Bordetella hinzii]KCB24513.1 alcohol dehydrogenase, iron-dependent [Bordetella hinzii OH87 BAL007II]KCB39377.1 alcohol dehydrogenase, iron-dependent [Bordetella hinzii 5132]